MLLLSLGISMVDDSAHSLARHNQPFSNGWSVEDNSHLNSHLTMLFGSVLKRDGAVIGQLGILAG